MISRDHSVIRGHRDASGNLVRYSISDRSLNGTYINDYRVKDAIELHDNDIIKFGHVNGAAIKAGEHAPQYKAEFAFVFERAYENHKYAGFTLDYQRIRPPGATNHSPFMSITSGNTQPLLFRDPTAAALAGLTPLGSRTCVAPPAPSAPLLAPKPSTDPPPRPPPSPAIQTPPTTTSAPSIPSTSTPGSSLAEQILAGTANRPTGFPYFPISSPFPFWAAWPGTSKNNAETATQWNPQQLAAAATAATAVTAQSTSQPTNPLQAAAAAVAAYQASMGVDYATACAAMGLRPPVQPTQPVKNGDTRDLAACVRNVHNRAAQQNANQAAAEARAAEAARIARQPLPPTNLQTITGFAQNMHNMSGVRELQAALAAQHMTYPFSTTASLLIGNPSDALRIGTPNSLQSAFPNIAQPQPSRPKSPAPSSSSETAKPTLPNSALMGASGYAFNSSTTSSFRQVRHPSPPTVASPIPQRPTANCLPHSVANALGVSTTGLGSSLLNQRRTEALQNELNEKTIFSSRLHHLSAQSELQSNSGSIPPCDPSHRVNVTSPKVPEVPSAPPSADFTTKESNRDHSATSSNDTPPSVKRMECDSSVPSPPKNSIAIENLLNEAPKSAVENEVTTVTVKKEIIEKDNDEPARDGSRSPSHHSVSSHSPPHTSRLKSSPSGISRSPSPSLKEELPRSASPAHSHRSDRSNKTSHSNHSIRSIKSLHSNKTSSNPSSISRTPKRHLDQTTSDEESSVKAKKPKQEKPTVRHKQNDLSRLLSDLDGSFMHQAALSSRRSGARTNATRLESLKTKNNKPSGTRNQDNKNAMKQISDESSVEDQSDQSDSSLPSVKTTRQSKNNTAKVLQKKNKKRRNKTSDSSTFDDESESDQSSVDVKPPKSRARPVQSPAQKSQRGTSSRASDLSEKKTPKKKPTGRPRKQSGTSWKKEDSSEDSASGSGDEEDEPRTKKKSSSSGTNGDVWGYHDAERDECAHKKCQHPQSDNVNWVQCDGCDQWYHCFCFFGTEKEHGDNQFFCSKACKAPKSKSLSRMTRQTIK